MFVNLNTLSNKIIFSRKKYLKSIKVIFKISDIYYENKYLINKA
jgi:hypothetical protein